MSKRFIKFGIEETDNYLRLSCGWFTLHFCRCGSCFLPQLVAHEVRVKERTCGFCFKSFDYDEMPDGSVCYLGIFACADCLKKDVTKELGEIL